MVIQNKEEIEQQKGKVFTQEELENLRSSEKSYKSLNARLQHIFNTLDNSFWGADMVSYKMLYVSPGNFKIYGYHDDEFMRNGNLWYEVIIPEDKHIGDWLKVEITKGNPITTEYRIRHKNGSIRWIEARLSPTLDEQGKLILLDGIALDITERKKAINKIFRSEEQFKSLIENISGVYWVNNLETYQTLYISPSYETIWGRSCEELYHDPSAFINSVHPDDRAVLFEAHTNIIEYKQVNIAYRIIRPDGEIRWISAKTNVKVDESGNKIEYGYAEDVTEKKKAEEARAKSEKNLNEAQRLAKIGSFECNLDTMDLIWSKEHYRIFELQETAPDKLWQLCRTKIYPDDLSKLDAALESAVKKGKGINVEHRIICKDGSIKFLLGTGETFKSADGKWNMLRGTVQDITDSKKSQQLLSQRENHLRTMLNAEPECVKLLNRKGELLEINAAGLAMVQADNIDLLLGKEVFHLINSKYRKAFAELIDKVFEGGSGKLEFELIGLKGRQLWLETNAVPLRDDKGEIFAQLSITRDITLQKKAEFEVKQSEQQLLEAQRIAGIGNFTYNFKTGIWKCSSTLDELTGLDPQAIMVFDNWVALISPDVKEEITNKIFPLIQEGVIPAGHYLDCKINRANDGEERWLSIVGELEKDEEGNPLILKGTVQDITERKKAEDEIKRLNELLEQKVEERTAELKQLNKELEAFNHTVSHDLQNPIRSLSGFSRLLISDYSDKLDEDGREYLTAIEVNAKRMSALVRDLLGFAKLGKVAVAKVNVDMKKVAQSSIYEIKSANVNLNTKIILHDLAPAFCDAGLIRQVWDNLIGNAVKYSSKKEKPVVEIGMQRLNGEDTYYVKDNGAGFDMKYADKLFKVFERLHSKNEFEGTGVGLSTVERIITKQGGKIWAEGEENAGAIFYFTTPQKKEEDIA